MDYSETPPPPALAGLVKCRWTLRTGGGADWIDQDATPDGCVELIHRLRGASRWDGDQPTSFIVGLVDRPQLFQIRGDAEFSALRLWPWAWTHVGDIALPALHGRWHAHAPFDFDAIETALGDAPALAAVGRAIVDAASVADMAAGAGLSPRALQRWFAAHVGMPPRRYLRLLRFQRGFAGAPDAPDLADHAAAQGFADQAHMTREFRTFSGATPRRVVRAAQGPFIAPDRG